MEVDVTIVFPVHVTIDLDMKKVKEDDQEYKLQKQEEAYEKASQIMESTPTDAVVHDSEISWLIE